MTIHNHDMTVPLRPAGEVMRLARMGAFHQSRLSFMRSLLRRLKDENWQFKVDKFEIDEQCVGRAVYCAVGPTQTYSLVAFAHNLPDEMRSDRVIATAWDTTFTLFNGVPTEDDLKRLEANVPLQEAGRISSNEISLSRANRSNRAWQHVVEKLAAGQQPAPDIITQVGYLMRTTAVYGNGKFGAADRTTVQNLPLLDAPFYAELLSVYLTRAFVMDLAEHAAKMKGGDAAVTMQPHLRRQFGIGNSTGLGMAPFLTFHPALLNNWVAARETALSRVRSVKTATPDAINQFKIMLKRATKNAQDWQSEHPLQIEKIRDLRSDLKQLGTYCKTTTFDVDYPWNNLMLWAEEHLSFEGQEQLVSLMLEPYPELVDQLVDGMKANEADCFPIDGTVSVEHTIHCIQDHYGWALGVDYNAPENSARFWYVSEEKLEPRLGERHEEDGAELEQPHTIARDVDAFYQCLQSWPAETQLCNVLLKHPEYRNIARRVQITHDMPYAEMRDNQTCASMLPIDMLRCKLSFFGATRFDPRSDRWLRICMYQNAPYPDELANTPSDDWAYPEIQS